MKLFLSILFLLCVPTQADQPLPSTTYNAEVITIKDGDTIVANIELGLGVFKHNEIIRFLGVYAPETFRPKNDKEREDGTIVRKFLQDRLEVGEKIVIVTTKDKRDGFGRLLGVVWDVDGNVNEDILEFMKSKNILENKK